MLDSAIMGEIHAAAANGKDTLAPERPGEVCGWCLGQKRLISPTRGLIKCPTCQGSGKKGGAK